MAGVFPSLFVSQNNSKSFSRILRKLSGNADNDVDNYAHDDVLDSRSKYKGP